MTTITRTYKVLEDGTEVLVSTCYSREPKIFKEMRERKQMEDNKDKLAAIMHNVSKDMGLRPFKLGPINLTLGVPKSEFKDFLDDPETFLMGDHKNVSSADVIAVAKVICAVSDILSTSVCPLIK